MKHLDKYCKTSFNEYGEFDQLIQKINEGKNNKVCTDNTYSALISHIFTHIFNTSTYSKPTLHQNTVMLNYVTFVFIQSARIGSQTEVEQRRERLLQYPWNLRVQTVLSRAATDAVYVGPSKIRGAGTYLWHTQHILRIYSYFRLLFSTYFKHIYILYLLYTYFTPVVMPVVMNMFAGLHIHGTLRMGGIHDKKGLKIYVGGIIHRSNSDWIASPRGQNRLYHPGEYQRQKSLPGRQGYGERRGAVDQRCVWPLWQHQSKFKGDQMNAVPWPIEHILKTYLSHLWLFCTYLENFTYFKHTSYILSTLNILRIANIFQTYLMIGFSKYTQDAVFYQLRFWKWNSARPKKGFQTVEERGPSSLYPGDILVRLRTECGTVRSLRTPVLEWFHSLF